MLLCALSPTRTADCSMLAWEDWETEGHVYAEPLLAQDCILPACSTQGIKLEGRHAEVQDELGHAATKGHGPAEKATRDSSSAPTAQEFAHAESSTLQPSRETTEQPTGVQERNALRTATVRTVLYRQLHLLSLALYSCCYA